MDVTDCAYHLLESIDRKISLTNCLRGIRNAWHLQHAVSFVIKAACGSFCSALLTP
ncbi:DUF3265 domain-containing protein [Vibrio navarrensis]|nr:DUF3265 domain-containing protein [Vibrio navarrensis]QOD68638.1 DUF3265 domain-containing protein [Vibrio navarrensis]QOD68673.1 DUF3265 domain-containing protein [Vibrio navarrensis]